MVPKPRLAAFWSVASGRFILAVAIAWLFFNQGMLADVRGQEAKTSAKRRTGEGRGRAEAASVTWQPQTIRFRVVDAAGETSRSVLPRS